MKIFFITPTGGRTGSEMMIWYLLKYLKETVIKTAIYTRQNGELFAENSPANETFINKTNQNFTYKIYEGIYRKIFGRIPELTKVEAIHRKIKPDFWYLNTLTMPEMAELATKLGVPYFLHAHELPTVYDELKENEFSAMLKNAHKIICCSSIVERRIRQMGYKNTVIKHEFIDVSQIKIQTQPQEIRTKLGIPENAFVWLMSGTMNLRKGYDLVPDLLENLPKNHYLVWLGSEKQTGTLHYIKQRIALEKQNFIHLAAKSADYYDYLNICDGFVLLSREDPFPLVMMEAAYLQKPIVGFDSGGISEFLLDGMGGFVPSFNPKDLANLMIKIEKGEI